MPLACGVVVCVLSLGCFGCVRYRVTLPSSLVAAKESYSRHRDLQSLEALMGGLRLGMPEEAVRALLGDPDMCPVEGQCYYSSDKQDSRGYTMTLVVEYRYDVLSPAGEVDMIVSHRLEQYSLGPVGE